jgi:hypothetical protein
MAPSTCAAHPQSAARFQCDGCGKLLCDACIEESHRLLLCRLCGERALPLAAGAPATAQERQLTQKAAAVTAQGPYGLGKALLYPFRGSGLFLFIAALISAGFVTFMVKVGFGCLPLILWAGWLSLLVGIQFKIVASTAKWEDELPDWPEYMSFGERFVEIATYVVIALLNYGPLVAFVFAFGMEGLATGEPELGFWLGAAAALWLGTALSVMAWGAAAIHWRRSALRVDQHLRALFATGGDALKTTNITFVMLGLVVVLRGVLGSAVPYVGAALAGILGLYWAFVAPHLVGLLFRRHAAALHEIYEG